MTVTAKKTLILSLVILGSSFAFGLLADTEGPGGTCRALGTVTVNGNCNGVLKCGFRDEDIYRIPCCSDFGKLSGWCKESSGLVEGSC